MIRAAAGRNRFFVIAAIAVAAVVVLIVKCSYEERVVIPAEAPPAGATAPRPKVPLVRHAVGGNSPESGLPPAAGGAGQSTTAACQACEKDHIKSGECEPDSGCDGLEGGDQELCLRLLSCLRATNCWTRDPLDCLCGTAGGVACASGSANGECKEEMQAATKTTDPMKNGTLFLRPDGPGRPRESTDRLRSRHLSVGLRAPLSAQCNSGNQSHDTPIRIVGCMFGFSSGDDFSTAAIGINRRKYCLSRWARKIFRN
jgi:hypothetical protein